MTARNFLKPKNFKIKAKSLRFESVKFMTDLDKKKVYINFVKLLNNHFKKSLFKKNLYEHFICHYGFIAHYNIHGFYGEYFETAAKFHFNVNNYTTPPHENSGDLNQSSELSNGELFYEIYEEINNGQYGLGEFYNEIISNQNYGGYDDYKDLDDAIKDAFYEYLEIWRDEIRKAVKAYDKFSKDEKVAELQAKQKAITEAQMKLNESLRDVQNTLEDKAIKAQSKEVKDVAPGTQMSLFDLMEVA